VTEKGHVAGQGLPGQTRFHVSEWRHEKNSLGQEWRGVRASPSQQPHPDIHGEPACSCRACVKEPDPCPASSHPHSLPLGLPAGTSTDKDICYRFPANCFLSISLV
jgi:hypothetical protein